MPFFKKLFGTVEDKLDIEETIEEVIDISTGEDLDTAKPANDLLTLSEKQIYLQQTFTNKEEVLRFIADKMSDLGFVDDDYFNALLKREDKVCTYLINGVAIPHGVNEAKALVIKTGVIIVQIPTGINWNDKGDIAKFVVGIAAKGNDHLALLQKLSSVVMDTTLSENLITTTEPQQIIQALQTEPHPKASVQEGFTITAEATVVDKYGLHAEPAAILAEHAASYENTQIHLHSGGRCANIKSMSVILMMGIKEGDTILISAKGKHARAAVDNLAALINSGLSTPDDEISN